MFSGEALQPHEIRLELSSDEDLFFGFKFDCTENGWYSFANNNRIHAGWEQFMPLLKQLLSEVGVFKSGGRSILELDLAGEGAAMLSFVQDAEFST